MNCSPPQNETDPGPVVWLTGLPASGKTTIARQLQSELRRHGCQAVLLDSDRLREVLTPSPTYDSAERDFFYAALVGLAGMIAQQGVPAIIAATGNLRRYRQAAHDRLDRFMEVWVDCPLEVCQSRDPKRLYAQADQRAGNALPGLGAGYEPPIEPALTIHSDREPAERSMQRIVDALSERGWLF